MIRDFNFRLGALVLVQNSNIKTNLGRKAKPRYIGPMVVVRRTQNGSYHLAKLDSTILNLCFAAFHPVPYHAHSCTSITVMPQGAREFRSLPLYLELFQSSHHSCMSASSSEQVQVALDYVELRAYRHYRIDSYFISGRKETLQNQEIEYKVHILRLLADQKHHLQFDPSYVPTPVLHERLSQSFYVSSENVVKCVTS